MHSHGGAAAVSDHSSTSKPKKPKSREVSSRFLSPTSTDHANQPSNTHFLSPLKQKPRSSTDSRKHKSLESSGFLRGLWPASSAPLPSSTSRPDTLADCIGSDRRKDVEERNSSKEKPDRNSLLLNRQRSCTEFSRFENGKRIDSAKENHNPIFGGSLRYTGKFKFPRKSSKSSNLQDIENDILPGRFSVDENSLRKKSFSRGLSDSDTQDSESEYSDIYSGGTSLDIPAAGKDFPASYMSPTVSSRKHGIDVPSKFMHDPSSRSRRWSADSGLNQKPVSSNSNSPKIFNPTKKGNGATPPGRAGSPQAPLSDSKGRMTGITGLKPPTSPSRGKRVGNILSLGIEFLKGKKSSSSSSSSPLGPGSNENAYHELRLMHNRLMQWRYSNARAQAVNGNIIKQVERNFLHVWNVLINLHHSVLHNKFQLQKEKLNMKLNYILHSQKRGLETWGNIERQHSSAVSTTTDCLHSVICRIPLVDGAKVELQPASVAIRHASDLAASINMMLTTLSPSVEKSVGILAELATVVIQEKQLLEDSLELFRNISALEIQERSLKSNIMQLRLLQQQQQQILV